MMKLRKWIAITTIVGLLGMTGCAPAASDAIDPQGGADAGTNAGTDAGTTPDAYPALDELDLSQYKESADLMSFFTGTPNLSAKKADGTPYKIAYSHYDEADESVAFTCRMSKEIAAQYGFDLIIFDAQQDPQKQRDHIAQAITQQCDAIVVNPLDATSVSGAMKKAREAGLVVINAAMVVSDQEAYDVYTGPDDTVAGQMAASALIELLPEGGKVGIIQGFPGSSPQINRDAGFLGVMQNYPAYEIFDSQTANWSTSDAMNVMESYMAKHPEIDAIFSHFDLATLAAIQAAQGAGRADDIIFVSVDGTQGALDAIAAGGSFKMTSMQDFKTMAELQFAAALALLNGDGDKIEKDTYMDTICIMQDNASNFDAGWG